MKKDDFRPIQNKEQEETDRDHMQTVSATEFTGLIPAGLTYDEDADMYDELCPYLPPNAYMRGFGDLEK
ncbi:MAG: hypothetical protein IJF80_01995 [Clostridia bacterium]|nr:hypothetical protein [Clostridia bacterium]